MFLTLPLGSGLYTSRFTDHWWFHPPSGRVAVSAAGRASRTTHRMAGNSEKRTSRITAAPQKTRWG